MEPKLPGSVTVSTTVVNRRYGTEEEKNVGHPIELADFGVDPACLARVGAEIGVTINTGNYESLKIAVSVSLPTYVEEIEGAKKEVFRICEEEISERVAQFNTRLALAFTKK